MGWFGCVPFPTATGEEVTWPTAANNKVMQGEESKKTTSKKSSEESRDAMREMAAG